MRPGMADAAAEAGVSTTTVSHALHGARCVAEATWRRVPDAVDRLQDQVHTVAESLRPQRSLAPGRPMTDLGNPFFTAPVRGIRDVANRAGDSAILCGTDEGLQKERDLPAGALAPSGRRHRDGSDRLPARARG